MAHVHAAPERSAATPPGWSYNPSAWHERRWLVALAAIGSLAALVTGLSQVGVLPPLWDPFFGSASSYAVTHSVISRALPLPDGLLGVVGYLCDLVFGTIGGDDRWHSKPWAVLLFALTITGLGVVSLALTILQGALIGHWCTICIISAGVSLLVFGLGIGEALPTLQYLARTRYDRGWAGARQALMGAAGSKRPQPRRSFASTTHETDGIPAME